MKLLIPICCEDGREVYINPAHISSISPFIIEDDVDTGMVRIFMSNGRSYLVKDAVYELAHAIIDYVELPV